MTWTATVISSTYLLLKKTTTLQTYTATWKITTFCPHGLSFWWVKSIHENHEGELCVFDFDFCHVFIASSWTKEEMFLVSVTKVNSRRKTASSFFWLQLLPLLLGCQKKRESELFKDNTYVSNWLTFKVLWRHLPVFSPQHVSSLPSKWSYLS